MTSIVQKLYDSNLLNLEQNFILDTEFEVQMGSIAYGADMENSSDNDIHGFCIPPKEIIFPHLAKNYVEGFSNRIPNFESWHQHHIDYGTAQYDVCIYSIVKFFKLAMDNNPNVLDVLFVPNHCHIKVSPIAQHILNNRKKFLSKLSFHRFSGYSFSQMKQLTQNKRKDLIDKFGFDTKAAYHAVRLSLQAIQILETGDLDLDVNGKLLRSIRRGEYELEEIKEMLVNYEKQAKVLYDTGTLQYSSNIKELEELLIECLEMKFGKI